MVAAARKFKLDAGSINRTLRRGEIDLKCNSLTWNSISATIAVVEVFMHRDRSKNLVYRVVELDGVRYAILAEAELREVCRRAALQATVSGEKGEPSDDWAEIEPFDGEMLAARLVARRKRAGFSQARLAREAGVRVETLNRIERGKVTPDFSTIRKLATAIKAAEAAARV